MHFIMHFRSNYNAKKKLEGRQTWSDGVNKAASSDCNLHAFEIECVQFVGH